jgi:hypothetical protein
MASLAQIYAFTFGNPDFKQRFAAARMQAAWDIIGETPQSPRAPRVGQEDLRLAVGRS